MQRDYENNLHGVDPLAIAGGPSLPGQPAVGKDPTQGKGSDAWQRAVKMSMELNARSRRN